MLCKLLLPRPRSIRLGSGTVPAGTPVHEVIDHGKSQGYRLSIKESDVVIHAADAAGAFYARQTLAQLHTLFGQSLPAMEIDDHPDFPARGVMLDISRDKVPTMDTLRSIIDELASLKINQFQLYTEHTFAYQNHRDVWKDASPLTHVEITELRAYCRERFIELVPNQNSFGHMERWLKHDRYRPLGEAQNGFVWPSGLRQEEPFSLCPTDEGSIKLMAELYDELLPLFDSKLFNVGCDETFDLGQPGTRSEELCNTRGKHRVYLDYLKRIHKLCTERNRRMMFWGDIVLESPELIPELPKDAIALEWGYEADAKFDERLEKLCASGLDVYVCPGTSSWMTFAGRTDNAIGNLTSAARAGMKHGAIGFLNTDWGDWGHLQYWPVSYLPIAYGAAVSWCGETNANVDVSPALNRHIFRDSSDTISQVFRDLGNVYTSGKLIPNSTLLFRIFWTAADKLAGTLEGVGIEMLVDQEKQITTILPRIERFSSGRSDTRSIADELRNAAEMMIHAARRGRWALGDPAISNHQLRGQLSAIIDQHRRLWIARNREGGLADSVAKLQSRLAEY